MTNKIHGQSLSGAEGEPPPRERSPDVSKIFNEQYSAKDAKCEQWWGFVVPKYPVLKLLIRLLS